MNKAQNRVLGNESSRIIEDRHPLTLVRKYIQDTGVNILDLGCGNKSFLHQLQDEGYKNLSGIDSFNYGNATFNFQSADFSYEKLPYPDNTFSLITAWEVFEHLENPYFALREVRRVLKPNGILMLSMPNPFHWICRLHFALYGDIPGWKANNDHKNIFTNKLFEKAFIRKTGFNLLERNFAVSRVNQKLKGGLMSRFSWLDKYLPNNELFGTFVIYILRHE